MLFQGHAPHTLSPRARALTVVALVGVLASSCAHVLVRPQADQVKRVAVVSVYMNRHIYNVEAPKAAEGIGLGSLVRAAAKAVAPKLDITNDPNQQRLVSFGLQTFSRQLNAIPQWEVVSPLDIVSAQPYQNFHKGGATGTWGTLMGGLAKLMLDNYVAPDGMVVIPVNSALGDTAPNGTVHMRFGDAANTNEAAFRKALGKLARDLGVDAVAMIQMDAAYDHGWAKVTFLGKTRAFPKVAIAAVMVNQEGEIVLKTPMITKGEGDRFEGEKLGMLTGDRVLLGDPEVQSSFNEAFEKAGAALQKTISEEFQP